MLRFLLSAALVVSALAAQPDTTNATAIAADELWLKLSLTGSRRLMGLVVAPFSVPAGTPAPLPEAVTETRDVFEADLRFSLHFVVARPDSGTSFNFSTDAKKLDFKGWTTTGAEVLVCGDLSARRSGYQLTLRIYDLASARLIASKSYALTDNRRWLAHQMADEVIKQLTGEDGISRTRIAFSQPLASGCKELSCVDYDGANPVLLTSSGGLKLSPDWSPRGDQIAFCSFGRSTLNIYLLDLVARRASQLSERAGLNTTPAWSPDGRRVAVSLSFEGNSELYVMDANGKGLRRLTASSGIDISPSWDPSGRQLAFVSDRTGSPQVYVMNADGTDLRRLTFEGSYNTSPAWSPRGDLIAFVQRQPGGLNQVCVTNLLGDTYTRLTSQGNNEDPCWSPDGLHLAFASSRTGRWEVFTMDWNGTNQRPVSSNGGTSPTWSPRLTK